MKQTWKKKTEDFKFVLRRSIRKCNAKWNQHNNLEQFLWGTTALKSTRIKLNCLWRTLIACLSNSGKKPLARSSNLKQTKKQFFERIHIRFTSIKTKHNKKRKTKKKTLELSLMSGCTLIDKKSPQSFMTKPKCLPPKFNKKASCGSFDASE